MKTSPPTKDMETSINLTDDFVITITVVWTIDVIRLIKSQRENGILQDLFLDDLSAGVFELISLSGIQIEGDNYQFSRAGHFV